MNDAEQSCGAELAESAVVPEQLARLMSHVAENLEAHARWVGTGCAEAAREREGLLRVAAAYRGISTAALHAAGSMRSLTGLAPAPHDPARWDRPAFLRWMREKIELQRAFAALLLRHAEASERGLSGD